MTSELTVRQRPEAGALAEQVLLKGDLAKLTEEERAHYYTEVCRSLGLNPMTRPFELIVLNGRMVLYARRDAADQLRKLHGIGIQIVGRETTAGGLHVVTARATDRNGRSDESIGAVNVKGLGGEALANALMKAETKAKRRVTLSISGLGWLDETEIEDAGEDAAGLPTEAPLRGRARLRARLGAVAQSERPALPDEAVPLPTVAKLAGWVDPETEGGLDAAELMTAALRATGDEPPPERAPLPEEAAAPAPVEAPQDGGSGPNVAAPAAPPDSLTREELHRLARAADLSPGVLMEAALELYGRTHGLTDAERAMIGAAVGLV